MVPAVPEGGWVQLFSLERLRFVQILILNYKGMQRGWFHTGLVKDLDVFSFPSYIVALAVGFLAMLVLLSGFSHLMKNR